MIFYTEKSIVRVMHLTTMTSHSVHETDHGEVIDSADQGKKFLEAAGLSVTATIQEKELTDYRDKHVPHRAQWAAL